MRSITNCTYCNRAFKWHSSRQRHEQLDCPKRPKREVVIVGWDGASRPIPRYQDELHLPDHLRERP